MICMDIAYIGFDSWYNYQTENRFDKKDVKLSGWMDGIHVATRRRNAF